MNPSCGVQSTGNRPFQCGSSRAQFVPGNLLLCGLLCTGCSSYWEPGCAWVIQGLHLPSGCMHLLQHVILFEMQRGFVLHCGCPWAADREPASPWSPSWAVGESVLQAGQSLQQHVGRLEALNEKEIFRHTTKIFFSS